MSTIQIYASLYEDLDGIAGGWLPDTEGEEVSADDVETAALKRATVNAREAVDAGSGEEDWSGWRVQVLDQDDVRIADYDLEDLLEREAA